MINFCPELFITRITDEALRIGDAFANADHKNGYKNADEQSNDSRLLHETKAEQRHSAYSLQSGSMSYLSKHAISLLSFTEIPTCSKSDTGREKMVRCFIKLCFLNLECSPLPKHI